MKHIKKIPTSPIPDGYYEHQWSLEGAILRDKINEIIDAIGSTVVPTGTKCHCPQPTVYKMAPQPVPAPTPPQKTPIWVNPPIAPLRKEDYNA